MIGVLVEVVAGDVGEGESDGQLASGVDQPAVDLGDEPVDGLDVEGVQGGGGGVSVDTAVGAPAPHNVADSIGGVGVDAQHVAVAQPSAACMPVLYRAVAPGAVDEPDRGQVQYLADMRGVDADLVAQHRLHQELFLRGRESAPQTRAFICRHASPTCDPVPNVVADCNRAECDWVG